MDMAKIFSHFVDCLLSHWLDFAFQKHHSCMMSNLLITDLIAWTIRVLPIRTVMCLLWPCTQGHCPLSLLSGPVCLVLCGLLFLFRIKNIDLFAHSSACRACYSLTSTTCWRCCGVFGMFCLFLFLFLLAFLYVSWFLSNHQVCVCHRNYICVYTSIPLINCLFVCQYVARILL